MATINRRKFKTCVSYQVVIRRAGVRTITKSFMNRTDAKRWARNMETKLDRGDYSDYSTASKVTLGDLFKRYVKEEKHKKKKQWKNEEYHCSQLQLAYRLTGLVVRPIISPFLLIYKILFSDLFLIKLIRS